VEEEEEEEETCSACRMNSISTLKRSWRTCSGTTVAYGERERERERERETSIFK
jgi:hypothetical protein